MRGGRRGGGAAGPGARQRSRRGRSVPRLAGGPGARGPLAGDASSPPRRHRPPAENPSAGLGAAPRACCRANTRAGHPRSASAPDVDPVPRKRLSGRAASAVGFFVVSLEQIRGGDGRGKGQEGQRVTSKRRAKV